MTIKVPVGEKLGFTRDLERTDSWPPTRIRRKHGDGPAATPYLVVAADPNDLGSRPIPGTEAVHNPSVQIIDASGAVVSQPVAGVEYTLRATIRNLGAGPCYAGIAEYVIAGPAAIDAAASGLGTVPTYAVVGFSAQPNATVVVTCSRVWKPADAIEAAASIVVNVYDLLLDRPTRRFDARADRHVGRRDTIADFSGTWEGREFLVPPSQQSFLKRVVITQVGLAVTVSDFSQVGAPSALPATPQKTGASSIVNSQVQMMITELNDLNGQGTPPVPFTTNAMILTLLTPDTLRVTNHRVYVSPGDNRGPIDLVADLTRRDPNAPQDPVPDVFHRPGLPTGPIRMPPELQPLKPGVLP